VGHEVWEYTENGKAGIARLTDIKRICLDCSSIHHFGRTSRLVFDGKITRQEYQRIIKHFLTVNNCNMAVSKQHEHEAIAICQRRSAMQWTIEFGRYAPSGGKL
jgi:hypothetical protein